MRFIYLPVFFVLSALTLVSSHTEQLHTLLKENDVFGAKFAAVMPESLAIGGPLPYFKISVTINNELDINQTQTEMVLFHSSSSQFFGLQNGDWCCTKEFYDTKQCDREGGLAINFPQIQLKSNTRSFMSSYNSDVFYWGEQEMTHNFSISEKIRLPLTGMWYFIVAGCRNNSQEHIKGSVSFSNPYGFLSGHLFPRVPLHLSLTTAYFGFCIFWAILMLVYKKDLVPMQYAILLAICVGFLSELLWSISWYYFNLEGVAVYWINLLGALLTAVKLTVIRTLILLISIGYSILHETLDIVPKLGVISIAVVYGTFLGTFEYLAVLNDMDISANPSVYTAILTILTTINVLYAIWIAYSLCVNMKTLRNDPMQERSLKIYKKMSVGLSIACISAFLCFIVEEVLFYLNYQDKLWASWWLFPTFWEYFYFLLTIFVSLLWKPQPENAKFRKGYQPLEKSPSEPKLSLQSAPPMYRYKEDPQSPSFATKVVIAKKDSDDDTQSELDEVVL